MIRDKQINKVSKERQEYLKFKPFADDLRKAESWCELDGVLNRYQTVKNLSKMGYRKAYEVALGVISEIQAKIQIMVSSIKAQEEIGNISEFNGGAKTALEIVFKDIAELKKKYESEKDDEL